MKKIVSTFILLLIIGISTVTAQVTVGATTLPNTVSFEDENLDLNGYGVRKKAWFKLYSSGLYVTNKSKDAQAIINSDASMAIKLHITSRLISSEKMIKAVDEGFTNATNGKTAAIADKIKTFKSYFKDEISDGDVFDMAYTKGKGVTVYKNNKKKGTIKGLDFKKALFGIWLSNKPADKKLKSGLLGNTK